MKSCLKCRQPVPEDRRSCPHRGADTPHAVWPPPPSPAPPRSKDNLTPLDLLMVAAGVVTGLFICGFLAGFLPWGVLVLAFGVPMVSRKALPFVRGIGYVFLIVLACVLGVLMTTFR